MFQVLNRMAMALLAVIVAGGLAFGASHAFASGAVETCGDDYGEIGLCPPLTNTTCNTACATPPLPFFGGECIAGCCVCLT